MCGIVAIIGKHRKSDCSDALFRVKHRGMDDSRIYPISEKQIVSSDAYILFYQMVETDGMTFRL